MSALAAAARVERGMAAKSARRGAPPSMCRAQSLSRAARDGSGGYVVCGGCGATADRARESESERERERERERAREREREKEPGGG